MRSQKKRTRQPIVPPILYVLTGIALIVLVLYFWTTTEGRREHKIQKMLLDLPNVIDVNFTLFEGKSLAIIHTKNENKFVFARIYENSFNSPDTLFLSVINSYNIRCRNTDIDYSSFLDLANLKNISPSHRSYANLSDVFKHEQEILEWVEDTMPIKENDKQALHENQSCIRLYLP